ncbi:hypothetical protein TSTA_069650 [Talaromyces stipitatus ATCC 10500]|uniref:Uncharacterized protein n=1 Tax=Talaromyces stipitatus (strain ATCC 10500 / CBS 375.48 / QM 6759 / NRRL 1006) TaxID=441959 RepID=B8LT39_TALSN|nr:uncharacterized protein TSTA_069650 [Talaromyces stipitatus ATCC 10500]EED23547.1 hypothetical protein TSTA_069650 [Talaromyces stipitatus ATCC 10500]
MTVSLITLDVKGAFDAFFLADRSAAYTSKAGLPILSSGSHPLPLGDQFRSELMEESRYNQLIDYCRILTTLRLIADAMETNPTTTARSGRVVTLSTRAGEARDSSDNVTKVSKKTSAQVNGTIAVKKIARRIDEAQCGKATKEGILRKMCLFLESTQHEIMTLKDVVLKQEITIKEQHRMIKEQSKND